MHDNSQQVRHDTNLDGFSEFDGGLHFCVSSVLVVSGEVVPFLRRGGALRNSQRIRLEGNSLGKLVEISLSRVDGQSFRLVLEILADLLTRFLVKTME